MRCTKKPSLLKSEIFHDNLPLRDLTPVPSCRSTTGVKFTTWTLSARDSFLSCSISNWLPKLIPQAHKWLHMLEGANLIASCFQLEKLSYTSRGRLEDGHCVIYVTAGLLGAPALASAYGTSVPACGLQSLSACSGNTEVSSTQRSHYSTSIAHNWYQIDKKQASKQTKTLS